jgi:hypothetical protein
MEIDLSPRTYGTGRNFLRVKMSHFPTNYNYPFTPFQCQPSVMLWGKWMAFKGRCATNEGYWEEPLKVAEAFSLGLQIILRLLAWLLKGQYAVSDDFRVVCTQDVRSFLLRQKLSRTKNRSCPWLSINLGSRNTSVPTFYQGQWKA